jgi:hypothetical protein
MRKTDKKIDNQLRIELTDVCEVALKEIDGFQWLTHVVNYANFPNSLKVVCVFDTNTNLAVFMSHINKSELLCLIDNKLQKMGISLKNVSHHIVYDTQQNCEKDHQGKWADRLANG